MVLNQEQQARLKELILYIIFGVLTTAVNFVVYYTCTLGFGWYYQVANVLGWLISVTFAFVTNRIWVFNSHTVGTAFLKEIFWFFVARLASLFLEMGFMFVLVTMMHFNENIIKIIAQVVVIVANYLFSKLFIFKKPKKQASGEEK